jgi:hypothetical protein
MRRLRRCFWPAQSAFPMTQPEPDSLVHADGLDPAVAAQLASRFKAS